VTPHTHTHIHIHTLKHYTKPTHKHHTQRCDATCAHQAHLECQVKWAQDSNDTQHPQWVQMVVEWGERGGGVAREEGRWEGIAHSDTHKLSHTPTPQRFSATYPTQKPPVKACMSQKHHHSCPPPTTHSKYPRLTCPNNAPHSGGAGWWWWWWC
jgi:hypothetical protein